MIIFHPLEVVENLTDVSTSCQDGKQNAKKGYIDTRNDIYRKLRKTMKIFKLEQLTLKLVILF